MPLSKVISKARPNHPSLDFEVLRAEGVRHLEHFATELWSDYNAHDPGITILEVLCYAITDLGYRTRMIPVQDLMAMPGPRTSFGFLADEVLPGGPVTALDYRKLMIDVKGVKNAWMDSAGSEMKLYKKGLAFPEFQNSDGTWDLEKLKKAFADKKLIVDLSDAAKVQECLKDYIESFNSNASVEKLKSVIRIIGGGADVNSSIVKLEKNEVQQYFESLKPRPVNGLNEKYNGRLHSAVKKTTKTDYNKIIYGALDEEVINKINNFNTSYSGDFVVFQKKGFQNAILNKFEFKVFETGRSFDSLKNEFKTGFTSFPFKSEGTIDIIVDGIFNDLNNDLGKNTFDDIKKEYFKRLSNEEEEKLKTFYEKNKNNITKTDFDILFNHINGRFRPEDIKSQSANRLWTDITSESSKWSGFPVYSNLQRTAINVAATLEKIEKYEYGETSPDKDFNAFKNFILEDKPLTDQITESIYNGFINQYKFNEPTKNITYQVFKKKIAPVFNIETTNTSAIQQLIDDSKKSEIVGCEGLIGAVSKLFCEWGYWPVSLKDENLDSLPLSGLHTILLDLDESIDPDIPNDVNPVLNRVKAVLHANRALCEDFVEFKIVEDRPIGICLQLDISPDADEIEIIAEAIRRMQLYLSPAPRFRTFTERIAELKAAGENWSAEHIFNGPLLQNGFLVDVELGDNTLREKYFHSDLLTEIKLAGNGILGVPILQVKSKPEESAAIFEELTEYLVKGGEYKNGDFKAVIDLDRSNFRVTKGALSYEVSNTKIAERLELLRLIHDTDPLEPRGGPVWEEGVFRPDLGDYNSIQYEFPSNYSIGDNRLPAHITSKRRAQTKQLQAYLAFYDQILAAYLQQLGRVRQLLSVDQITDLPTRLLPLLYDMPGIRDLIGEDAPFEATATDWAVVLGRISDTMVSIPQINGEQNAQSDHKLVTEATVELRKKTQWEGIFELSDALAAALSKVHISLHENYTATIENFFWAKYTDNPNNKYAQMLREMAESPADHQRRRNQLLDHLLARFGESFSAYAATLLRPESEPEDNPLLQDYDAYLSSKAKFLKEAAQLSYGRNKGYNYKSFNTLQNSSDVWNTENVSGVQRRVSRLLGIDNWSARSLIAEPDFRIDGFKTASKRGMANYFGALRNRIAAANSPENPDEAIPLLKIPNHKSPKEIQRIISDLYEIIWQARYYKLDEIIPDAVQYWFTIVPHKDDYKVVFLKRSDDPKINLTLLESEVLSLDEAKLRIEVVIDLVKPKQQTKINEGFHIVEHILLRPLEADDALLKLSLGCEPTEVPRDPYSFWITVVAPAETTRFSDLDFRKTFEHTLRSELPAHIAARFAYLDLKALYDFEEQFGRWMFEKAKCNPPNYCRVDEETKKLVEILNNMPVECPCDEQEVDFDCNKTLSSSISS